MKENSRYRILMFAPAFAPFANPEAIVNNKLVLALKSAVCHVDVITRSDNELTDYNYGSGWEECWASLRTLTHAVTYRQTGKIGKIIDTIRGALKTGYPGIGCRWAAHAANLALRMHQEKGYDVIISRALPNFAHLPALLFARLTGLPWIANWNDAKNTPPVGKEPQARLGFFHERLLAEVAREATWHTFPSERMRRYICGYLGNETENRSSTIPHVLLESYQSTYRGKSSVFTLCYAGNLYAARNPSVFFQALAIFAKKSLDTRLKVNIIGLEKIGLSNLIKQYGLDNIVHFTGPLEYTETLDHCRESDVLIVIEAPYEEGIYLPSKFVDYVQTGRAILAISPATGTLRDLLSAYGGGIAADCTSVADIVCALDKLYAEWTLGILTEVYGSHRLYDLFSAGKVKERYKTILSEVVRLRCVGH